MKKPELLAPAGSMESLKAAICAGCDAVYLSGKKYGARSFATNFDNDELIEAIKLCHLYGIKIYVTVNTLIFEDEVEEFLNYIDFLHVNNVDAIIIQDIGMVDLIRKTYPNLELHASTQMHIHNLEGVKLLEKLNIKRAVLARETSIDTIKKIKNNTNLELEIFVHGALCVSYSGQCLMSYLIGGRSGNRGACAGSCRLPYDVIRENKKLNIGHYPLSMKDLNTLSNIDKLIDLNIDSIKIEGRMKRPEYVYIVVALYRKVIDEYVKKYEQFDDMIWMSGETEIGFETFCRALAKKAGISPRQAKEYVVSNLHNLEHEEAVDALLLALQIIKSENGLEGTQWNKPTCDFLKKEFEKMLGLNDGQENA